MTLDLDELERLEAAATPGPWETIADPLSGVPAFVKTPGELIAADAPADAAFIAAARNALPALLARVRGLEAERDRLTARNAFLEDEVLRLQEAMVWEESE